MSLLYPGAAHLFGIPYLVFGNHPYVIVPWLGFIQLLTACTCFLLFRNAGMGQKVAGLSLVYLLYCPAWLTLTNQLFRDILLEFGLVLAFLGIVYFLNRRCVIAILMTLCGVVVTISLREQYVVFFPAFILLAICIGRLRLVKLLPLAFLAVAVSLVVFTHYMGGIDSVSDKFQESMEGSQTLAVDAPESFVANWAGLSWESAPIAVPFRILVAIVSPFPWTSSQPSLAEQTGKWWVYAVFHMLQAVLHLAILMVVARSVIASLSRRGKLSKGELLFVLYGAGLTVAGSLAWVGFNRYVLLGFPFFLPLVVAQPKRWSFKAVLGVSLLAITSMHVAYYAIRSL